MTEGLTSADMYDEDIKKLGVMWNRLMQEFARKRNDHFAVSELVKRATDEAFNIGYVVRVHTTECLLGIGPATIEVVGRVEGHEVNKHGLDHDKKQYEIRKAVDRNEDAAIRRAIKAIEPPAR